LYCNAMCSFDTVDQHLPASFRICSGDAIHCIGIMEELPRASRGQAGNRSCYAGEGHVPVPRRGLHENANATHGGGRLTPPGEKIRVAVCDDHELFRRGVAEMLSLAGGIEVVGEAADHDEAIAVVLERRPDVVLLDLEMPGGAMGADESMGRMLGLSPPPRVVVFTMHDEPGMVGRFLSRGATAYFPKSAEMGELVGAVRDAARVDLGPPPDGAGTALASRAAPEGLPKTEYGRRGR